MLFGKGERQLRVSIRALMPDGKGVDDVQQETALECWRKFADFRGDDDPAVSRADEFVRWATVIARFKVREHFRDHGRDRLVFDDAVSKTITAAASRSRIDQRHLALEDCLKRLTAADRRLVLSIYRPGQSVALIAEQTGQAAKRLYRRVDVLRDHLMDCIEGRLANEQG
ncbi:MAG: RNA polymerase factor sigma-70 [Planctomycetota bacterium]